ncbi:BZ3500_MvSof-1268-A1-R1_Chr7-3g09710 [Microbotryum saponariae]|nr:BZ3501_MvSof-1269-A2-R1_Chr7-2g09433 [Microbotryum saponariae]SDA02458.1 BZ3500_MvSof-1268-A1-R1_Chr7-3g09710 [Microbotryum saponariae]
MMSLNYSGRVCVVFPFGEFDSSTQSWLVLYELGVIVEVPAGCCIAFPSALVTHGNVHLDVFLTDGGAPKCGETYSTRGSVVFWTPSRVISWL